MLIFSSRELAQISGDHVGLIADMEGLRPMLEQLWRTARPCQGRVSIHIREGWGVLTLDAPVAAESVENFSIGKSRWRAAALVDINPEEAVAMGQNAQDFGQR